MENQISLMYMSVDELMKCKGQFGVFCARGLNVGYCVKSRDHCLVPTPGARMTDLLERWRSPEGTRVASELLQMCYELRERQITYDGFEFGEIAAGLRSGKELPYEAPRTDTGRYLLRLKASAIPLAFGDYAYSSGQVGSVYAPDSFELLAWLLVGVRNGEMGSGSFLAYLFGGGTLEIPTVQRGSGYCTTDNGRHRIGMYSYFGIDGLILADESASQYLTAMQYATALTPRDATDIFGHPLRTVLYYEQKIDTAPSLAAKALANRTEGADLIMYALHDFHSGAAARQLPLTQKLRYRTYFNSFRDGLWGYHIDGDEVTVSFDDGETRRYHGYLAL